MSLIKSRRRIKNANGEYDIVYHETSTDLVRHNDGNTVADHMNGKLASTDGVHGFRYNETDKTFESYDPVNDTWNKIESPLFAEEYSAESVYAIGEYCIKDGALYKANQAITTAEEWTDSHWTETSVSAELKAIYTTLQNKADLGEDGKVPESQLPSMGFKPQIIVTTQAGNNVTVTSGETVFSGVAVDGTYTFSIPDYGTWKVVATNADGNQSESDVIVDACSRYYVNLLVYPKFSYTGDFEEVKGGSIYDWRLRLLSSGTLKFAKDYIIDVFLVGGGQGGGTSNANGNLAFGGEGVSTSFGSYSVNGGGKTSVNVNGGSGGGGFNNGKGGSDGGNGVGTNSGIGQGTTTREFGESSGMLYAAGGGCGTGKAGDDSAADGVGDTTVGNNAPNNRGGGGGGCYGGCGGGGGYTATYENVNVTANTNIQVFIGKGGKGVSSGDRLGGNGGSGIVVIRMA